MTHTVQDFFKHELNEMHKNVDRIKHGLEGQDPDKPSLVGQYMMLEMQEAHLKFIEELIRRATSFDTATKICREQVIQHEMAHMQVAVKENQHSALYSDQWWHSLHQIQFYSDFLGRIRNWRQAYA